MIVAIFHTRKPWEAQVVLWHALVYATEGGEMM